MLTMRRLLGGMLVVLLVSGVACEQPPSVQAPAQTISTDTPEIAALRVKANAGRAFSQYNLGVMYGVGGDGVPRDYAQAAAWYRKAADQGYASAQDSLGYAYNVGRGVSQDYVEAHKWFNLAASRASGADQKRYAEWRDGVAKLMTPAQLAEAEKLAREWMAAFEKRGGK